LGCRWRSYTRPSGRHKDARNTARLMGSILQF
jgi:hypothetical protein